MQKRPSKGIAKAITFHEFESSRRASSRPPEPHESALNRIFTSLAHVTGLTRYARLRLVRQIEQTDKEVAARIQHLYQLLNTVVDGGWVGLWTSVRVCAGAV